MAGERKLTKVAKVMSDLDEEFKWIELFAQVQNVTIGRQEFLTKAANFSQEELEKIEKEGDWPIGVIDASLRKQAVSPGEQLRRSLERQTEDIVVRYLEKSPASLKNRVYGEMMAHIEEASKYAR